MPLTRTRPSDDDVVGLPEFAAAEAAKRRLVLELVELGLPIVDRIENPRLGCASTCCRAAGAVITGHDDGVITLDLAESDDVHREQLRVSMDEPYRTLLGHFRHEIGHYYFRSGAERPGAATRSRSCSAIPTRTTRRRWTGTTRRGRRRDGADTYISSYATMHPAEDWAETFAHYLHIRDTIDTAAAFGFAPAATRRRQADHRDGMGSNG